MQIFTGLHHPPVRIAFSPDGRFLAVGEERSRVHVWDTTGNRAEPLWSIFDGWLARHAVFAPDGALVYVNYGGVTRYDAQTGHKSKIPGLTGVMAAQFSPDGRFVVISLIADQNSRVLRFRCIRPTDGGWQDVWESEQKYNPDFYYRGHRELLFSTDGERFARVYSLSRRSASTSPTRIDVFATATGEVLAEWAAHLPTDIREGSLGADGVVALIYQRGLYGVHTAVKKSESVKRLNSTLKHFTFAAFSPDGSRLATTSNDTAATIWDPITWEVRKRYEWNIGRLRAVCFAPDGLRCAAAGDAGQAVVWDLDD